MEIGRDELDLRRPEPAERRRRDREDADLDLGRGEALRRVLAQLRSCGRIVADDEGHADHVVLLAYSFRVGSMPSSDCPSASKFVHVRLALLGHGVQVAEAPLERILVEDRVGAGGVIGEIHHLARLLDGEAGDAAAGDALRRRLIVSPRSACS